MKNLPHRSVFTIRFWFLGTIWLFVAITIGLLYNDLKASERNPLQDDAPSTKSELEKQVVKIFEQNCARAGCHSGSYPQQGLKLTPEAYFSTTINQPAKQKPSWMRIKPGEPDSSYLVQKILGTDKITGLRMPFGRDPLSESEISTIVEWIKGFSIEDTTLKQKVQPLALMPFNGWKVVNIPTTRTIDAGRWLFLIGHRFFPDVSQGYDAFYGLDGSASIFLNLGYAVTNDLYLNLGRSNVQDNVEFDVRYGLKNQFDNDKLPFAAGLQASINWITEKRQDEDRLRSEAFKFSGQLTLSHQIRDGFSVAVVPGLLFNPNSEEDGEDPLFTMGTGGKVHLYKSISLVGEWVPIVTGYTLTSTFGEFNRFDTWSGGIEIDVGGHVFQIIATNSAGLTTDQYMRGGDLDIRDGDFRLGFNIFRILQF